jgi:hypothetical protein
MGLKKGSESRGSKEQEAGSVKNRNQRGYASLFADQQKGMPSRCDFY